MAVIIKIYRTKVFVVLCSIFMLVFLTPTSAHATGMPQLDFRNPLVNGQVIWGCVIFLVFYFALSRAMLPRVGRVLEDRSKRIRDDLDIARKAKRDTDKAIAELQQARKDALIEAKEHLQSALEEERLATEKRIREVHDRLKAEIDEAERDISAEKERAPAPRLQPAPVLPGAVPAHRPGPVSEQPDHGPLLRPGQRPAGLLQAPRRHDPGLVSPAIRILPRLLRGRSQFPRAEHGLAGDRGQIWGTQDSRGHCLDLATSGQNAGHCGHHESRSPAGYLRCVHGGSDPS